MALVLAAGASKRLGRSKARALWSAGGDAPETLVHRAARVAAATAGVDDVWVIVPAADASLALLVADLPVGTQTNPAPTEGMASSIRIGIAEAARCGARGALVTTIDQPMIDSVDLSRLVRAVDEGAAMAAAGYADVVGIPAAFGASVFPALLALSGDRGARHLLRGAGESLVVVAMPGAAIDLDEEKDFAAAGEKGVR